MDLSRTNKRVAVAEKDHCCSNLGFVDHSQCLYMSATDSNSNFYINDYTGNNKSNNIIIYLNYNDKGQ